jgi:hypothetical protein
MSDKQMVTAEDLVKAIRCNTWSDLAMSLGFREIKLWESASMYYYWCIEHIAHHITLPTPTITGSLNGEAARFEVVYRGD